LSSSEPLLYSVGSKIQGKVIDCVMVTIPPPGKSIWAEQVLSNRVSEKKVTVGMNIKLYIHYSSGGNSGSVVV